MVIGLIGKDLSMTQSGRVNDIIGDGEYDYIFIELDDPEKIPRVLQDSHFDGFHVTNPYRTEVIKYMDELTDDAERIGAVNVVTRIPGGKLKGHNTDVKGLEISLRDSVTGKKCLVLGTGGAARTAVCALRDLGASDIVLVSRNPEDARRRIGDDYEIISYDKIYTHNASEVIINCTPVGKYTNIDHSPFADQRINMRIFNSLELAVDLIYNPYRTKFLQDAKRLTGCKTKSGLEMFIIQSLASRAIWLGRDYDKEEELRFVTPLKRKILENQLNVVAIGLPGSGKTTIMRRYAYELGMDFIDTDEETEKKMGMKITEALSESTMGEEYFSAMEQECVREIGRKRRKVIATGGGTAMNPINRDVLRANGIVVYVKRPLDMLDVKGRPLSMSALKEVFNSRDRVYRRTADMTVVNSRVFGGIRALTGEGNTYNFELKGFVYFIARKVEKYLNALADDEWT